MPAVPFGFGSLTNESRFLTPKMTTQLRSLHERLPDDTLLLHLRLLTHLNNHDPSHKPAIISCILTLASPSHKNTLFPHLMGSHGNNYHAPLGIPRCIMGEGMCKMAKVKYCTLKCFQLASTQAQLTTISLVIRLPAESHWFSWQFRNSNYSQHNTENQFIPTFWHCLMCW